MALKTDSAARLVLGTKAIVQKEAYQIEMISEIPKPVLAHIAWFSDATPVEGKRYFDIFDQDGFPVSSQHHFRTKRDFSADVELGDVADSSLRYGLDLWPDALRGPETD